MNDYRKPQIDRTETELEKVLDEEDHDLDDLLDDLDDGDDTQLVKTPASGRLVLNPKADREASTPICPDCKREIRRVESPNGLVEFRCGCDELQYFEFPEREDKA